MTKPNGYWTLENTLLEAKKVINELGYLPEDRELRKRNKSSLGAAILKNGGYYKFCKLLNIQKRKPEGYWTKESILAESKKVVDELGYLPSIREFYKTDKKGLGAAIAKKYGYSKIRKDLNINLTRKPLGYWNLENTLKECKKIIEEKGYLPAQIELHQMKKGIIGKAIGKNGGYYKIRELLGIANQNNSIKSVLDSMLDDYNNQKKSVL